MFNRFRKFVLFLVGVSVPIQGFAFDAGGIYATPFKLVTAVLFVLAMLQYATRSRGGWRDRKTIWMVTFLVSVGVATAMAIIAGLPPGAVVRYSTTMIALISFYFLLGYVLETKEDVVLLLWALVIGGVIVVAPGLTDLQRFTSGERFAGLAGQENLLGADMNVCLAIAVALFFRSRSRFARLFLIAAVVLALAGIGFSLSRSAFLGLAAMWGFWIYRSGRRGNVQYAVLALMLATASLAFAPESVYERVETIFDASKRAQDGSIQGRFVINAWAIRAFVSNPLVGVGAPRFATWVHEQPGTESVPWHTVHNAYLSTAAEQGLLGLLPLLAILWLSWADYSWCWRAARARRQMVDPVLRDLENLALFLQMGLLSGALGGLFHQQHRSKTLWMMIALSPVVAGLMRERLEALKGPSERRQPIFPPAPEPPGALARPSPG